MRFLTIMLTSSFLLLGCSDDTVAKLDGKGKPDTTVSKLDKGPSVDGVKGTDANGKDATGQMDLPVCTATTNISCGCISTCTSACGTDTTCIGNCTTKGCAEAQTKYNALANCAIAKCIADCLGGFNAKCFACANQQCATEEAACMANKC
jgi:hypothetical protein